MGCYGRGRRVLGLPDCQMLQRPKVEPRQPLGGADQPEGGAVVRHRRLGQQGRLLSVLEVKEGTHSYLKSSTLDYLRLLFVYFHLVSILRRSPRQAQREHWRQRWSTDHPEEELGHRFCWNNISLLVYYCVLSLNRLRVIEDTNNESLVAN